MRRYFWIAMLLPSILLPGLAWAGFEFGGGMEYFTAQTYARDARGYSFQTLLQSTLAKATMAYVAGPVTLRASGGLSDWATSGQWQGTNFSPGYLDPAYLWAWQQQVELDLEYTVWNGLGINAGFQDHQIKSYYATYTSGDLLHLAYRLQRYEIGLHYNALQTSSVRVEVLAAVAPQARLEVYQKPDVSDTANALPAYDSTGAGTLWHGGAQLHYRDSAGWGLDLLYDVGSAQFMRPRNLSEFSLRFGSITGYLSLVF